MIKNFIKTYRTYIFFGFLLIICMNGCASYNKMAYLDEGVNEKWAQVENVYQRRADLIPSLVKIVKGYAKHENSTLVDVIEARSKATAINIDASKLDSNTIKKFDEAQSGLTQALSKLMVLQERYPELKADKHFTELMTQLEGSENRITVERMKFNTSVVDYNRKIRVVPRKLWANLFGFESRAYFKAEKGSEKTPNFDF